MITPAPLRGAQQAQKGRHRSHAEAKGVRCDDGPSLVADVGALCGLIVGRGTGAVPARWAGRAPGPAKAARGRDPDLRSLTQPSGAAAALPDRSRGGWRKPTRGSCTPLTGRLPRADHEASRTAGSKNRAGKVEWGRRQGAAPPPSHVKRHAAAAAPHIEAPGSLSRAAGACEWPAVTCTLGLAWMTPCWDGVHIAREDIRSCLACDVGRAHNGTPPRSTLSMAGPADSSAA